MNIVITGASSGLGLTLTKVFAQNKHNVIAGIFDGVDNTQAKSIAASNKEYVHLVSLDVSSEDSVKAAAKTAEELFGKVDAVISCAGILLGIDMKGTILDTTLASLRANFEVNTIGVFNVIKHFLPVMTEEGKRLMLMITSEAGSTTTTGIKYPAYGVSKCAANKVVFKFRSALGENCGIYAVHPGRMNTEMGRENAQIEPEESANSFYGIVTGTIPIKDEGKGFINYRGEKMPL